MAKRAAQKKIQPTPDLETPHAPEVKAPVNVAVPNPKKDEIRDEGSDIKTVEIVKVDRLAPVEGFDPRLRLRTVANGVWRYICDDINHVSDEHFRSVLAKDFGIKENDMIYLVGQKKHRIVVV